ncbi:hypothetical protein HJB51_16530 [Rhizobium lentis]|nr:hypothetical protein [Rhizobium lentis]MBX5061902.1 hypothetical protein [Rhizobium lentis]MBX5070520.1 hypothetical protein [Rhizobium lentis]MBX5109583.1 hypothetical protein [Rhizobium lentis]
MIKFAAESVIEAREREICRTLRCGMETVHRPEEAALAAIFVNSNARSDFRLFRTLARLETLMV